MLTSAHIIIRLRCGGTLRLTVREYQVARLVCEDDVSLKKIAARLGMSLRTLETHIANINRKLPPDTERSGSRKTRYQLRDAEPLAPTG